MFFAIILFIPHLSLSPHSSLMRSKIILAWHSGEHQRSPKWTAIQSMEFPGSLNRWDRYHIIPQLAVCKRLERPAVGQKIRSQQILSQSWKLTMGPYKTSFLMFLLQQGHPILHFQDCERKCSWGGVERPIQRSIKLKHPLQQEWK